MSDTQDPPSYLELVEHLDGVATRLLDLLGGGWEIPVEDRPPPHIVWRHTLPNTRELYMETLGTDQSLEVRLVRQGAILRRVVFRYGGTPLPG